MSSFFTCATHGPADSDRARGASVAPSERVFTVDIHCHVAVPEASRLIDPALFAAKEPAVRFATPASREINRAQQQSVLPQLTTAEARLADMDRLGIDVQAISPAPTQYYYWAEPELGRQTARIVNDRLAEIAAQHRERFVALGAVPLQAPELAVAELRRCVGELGMRGVEIGSQVDGLELADPRFRPFFAAAEELDVLIFLHPLGFTHGERLATHYLNNIIGNPLEATIAVSHLIFGGVLERHPGLKICVAHGGGYLPTYAGRMDHAFHARSDCRDHISRPPSAYLRRLFFDTVVFDPDHLGWLVAKYGADHVLMGTDYPYDMAEPDPVAFVSRLALGAEDRARIMGGNAARLLKLPGGTGLRGRKT